MGKCCKSPSVFLLVPDSSLKISPRHRNRAHPVGSDRCLPTAPGCAVRDFSNLPPEHRRLESAQVPATRQGTAGDILEQVSLPFLSSVAGSGIVGSDNAQELKSTRRCPLAVPRAVPRQGPPRDKAGFPAPSPPTLANPAFRCSPVWEMRMQ